MMDLLSYNDYCWGKIPKPKKNFDQEEINKFLKYLRDIIQNDIAPGIDSSGFMRTMSYPPQKRVLAEGAESSLIESYDGCNELYEGCWVFYNPILKVDLSDVRLSKGTELDSISFFFQNKIVQFILKDQSFIEYNLSYCVGEKLREGILRYGKR